MFDKVLFPIDFSPSGSIVEKYILKNLENTKDLILLYVIDSSYYDIFDTSKKKLISELKKKVVEGLKKEALRLKPLNVRAIMSDGHPAEEIVKIAEKEDVSLIVMPSHSKLKFYSALIGSTTMKVLSKTKRPVLVLKVGKERKTKQK